MNTQRKRAYVQNLFNLSQYRAPNGLGILNKDNFARVMVESLNKAINPKEGPVKEKHVRKLLIGSYQAESGTFFWQYLPIIKLKESQIVCWKFCHVLHKMIRDGHQQVLQCSYDRRQVLLDCGNMWRHVEDGYGQLIYKYCTLLFNRINFLARNPGFPNDLKLTDAQLDEIGDNDPNIFFDLSCEIFDTLDDILRLQELVLVRMDLKHLNSMSSAGQCHLAPLVCCIQDSSLFYDYSVKILFKLHGSLPPFILEGHRSRFLCQHNSLKNFYINTSNLQYFKTLIQIPHLAEKPPNFMIASDLQQHVAPQVIMISNPDSPDQMLVDLGDDLDYSISSDQQQPVTSNSMQSFQSELESSQNRLGTSPDPQPSGSEQAQQTDSTVEDNNHERYSERIQELEIMVAELRSELDMERTNHESTRKKLQAEVEKVQGELQKARHDISNFKHQVINSKNAYDKLSDECKRAQHDNEISQVAMKKMVKELSDLRSRQRNEDQNLALVEQREEDLLVAEMNETDKIIKEATRKIEELSENSRKVESGVKLQVNEKISEVCTYLMKAVRNLIAQSRLLQREIVNSEVGQTNKEEFYKRNSAWTEGLISAANVVAMAAISLVDSADRTMSGRAKFTELAAAAHEVAAATTQLVVASRVKANRDNEKLKLLTNAAKQVNQCTLNVVDASRVCAELIEQQEVDKIDISSLSLHQTKKLEMETQVRLLELEDELGKERVKLGLLRRKHYEEEEAQSSNPETQTTESKPKV